MAVQIEQKALRIEQARTNGKGQTMGWVKTTEANGKMLAAVAQAATQAGLGNFSVEDFDLVTPAGNEPAVKIRDTQHTDLHHFWKLINHVRELTTKLGSDPAGLGSAISEAIEANKSKNMDKVISAMVDHKPIFRSSPE